jgi:hypothetical protein
MHQKLGQKMLSRLLKVLREIETIWMIGLVLIANSFINGTDQLVHITMEAVSRRQGFQLEPETFNGVEERAILGQPHHVEPFLKQTQGGHGRFTPVIRGIIHNHDHFHVGILGEHDMLNKLDEAVAVFMIFGLVGHPSIPPIVSAKGMGIVWRAGRRNAFALPAFHPTAPQNRMQTYARFIHKEEDEGVVSEGLFFNQSSRSSAAAFASSSCNSLRSCLGWR